MNCIYHLGFIQDPSFVNLDIFRNVLVEREFLHVPLKRPIMNTQ